MRTLDLSTWPRRDHFHFFRQFDEPFWGTTLRVDAAAAHARSRMEGHSFFLYYLHKCLVAVNAVEAFRYRIRGEAVVIHDVIHASATVGRDDGSFDFSYMRFDPDFRVFQEEARAEVERIRNGSGLNPEVAGDDVIHFSALPWLEFTGLSHARHYGAADSCPKISVGRLSDHAGRYGMPVSVHVHHALVDGRHVGDFMEVFQREMA